MSRNLRLFRYFLVILVILGAFYLGLAYGLASKYMSSGEPGIIDAALSKNRNIVSDIEGIIEENYIGEVDEDVVYYSLMAGLVAGLQDQYSEYLNPDESKLFWEDVNGEYEGVGIEITMHEGSVYILSVIDKSPAFDAGILPGDVILAVDDELVEGLTLSQIASRIKGEKGTNVKLIILRETEILEVELVRQRVEADSVYINQDGDVLNIAIYRFDDNTDRELTDKLADFDINQIQGIILDVRGNPGGYFDTSVEVADQFIADGLIVSEKMGNGVVEEYKANAGDSLEAIPVVVLVDEFSASAAEILAGAMKDHNRATLVGQKTYGKGSVQIIEDLSDGSILKLTVAEWLTPDGHNLREEGIIPDVEVVNENLDVDSQYAKAKEILINN